MGALDRHEYSAAGALFAEAQRLYAAAAQAAYPEGVGVYRTILGDHPENLKARLGLARILSWMPAYGAAVAHAGTRVQGGRPLREHQTVANMLADILYTYLDPRVKAN